MVKTTFLTDNNHKMICEYADKMKIKKIALTNAILAFVFSQKEEKIKSSILEGIDTMNVI